MRLICWRRRFPTISKCLPYSELNEQFTVCCWKICSFIGNKCIKIMRCVVDNHWLYTNIYTHAASKWVGKWVSKYIKIDFGAKIAVRIILNQLVKLSKCHVRFVLAIQFNWREQVQARCVISCGQWPWNGRDCSCYWINSEHAIFHAK